MPPPPPPAPPPSPPPPPPAPPPSPPPPPPAPPPSAPPPPIDPDEEEGRTRTIYPGEGVIKFKQDFTEEVIFIPEEIQTINTLRAACFQMGLIGVYPGDHPEFPGIGFGNVSQRVGRGTGFIITGSATGSIPSLGPSHYSLVEHFDIQGNYVMARGGTPASSESLTHAALYQALPETKFIVHGHHPGLWAKREELGFPETSPDVPYGTPGMAREIKRIISDATDGQIPLIAMGGHTDGIISWGSNADELAARLEGFLKEFSSNE